MIQEQQQGCATILRLVLTFSFSGFGRSSPLLPWYIYMSCKQTFSNISKHLHVLQTNIFKQQPTFKCRLKNIYKHQQTFTCHLNKQKIHLWHPRHYQCCCISFAVTHFLLFIHSTERYFDVLFCIFIVQIFCIFYISFFCTFAI